MISVITSHGNLWEILDSGIDVSLPGNTCSMAPSIQPKNTEIQFHCSGGRLWRVQHITCAVATHIRRWAAGHKCPEVFDADGLFTAYFFTTSTSPACLHILQTRLDNRTFTTVNYGRIIHSPDAIGCIMRSSGTSTVPQRTSVTWVRVSLLVRHQGHMPCNTVTDGAPTLTRSASKSLLVVLWNRTECVITHERKVKTPTMKCNNQICRQVTTSYFQIAYMTYRKYLDGIHSCLIKISCLPQSISIIFFSSKLLSSNKQSVVLENDCDVKLY